MDNNLRIPFAEWLQQIPKLKLSSSWILMALDEASDYALRHGLSKKPLWTITEPTEYTRTCQKLLGMRIFRITHRKTAQFLDKAHRYYRDFLESIKQAEEAAKQNTAREAPSSDDSSEQVIQSFFDWLTTTARMPTTTARSYASSLKMLSKYVIEKSFVDINILQLPSAEVEKTVIAILENPVFKAYNAEQHHRFSAALKKYAAFCVGEERLSDTFGRKTAKASDVRQELVADGALTPDVQENLLSYKDTGFSFENKTPYYSGNKASLITSRASDEEKDSEIDFLLADQIFAPLREALAQNDIRTLARLKAIKLWPFMNRYNLYSIGLRQTVLEQVNELLYPQPEADNSQLFILQAGDRTYKGDTPSHAFLRLCDDYTKRYPLQFRLLVGARMHDGVTVPIHKTEDGDSLRRLTNLPAYISEKLSKEQAVRYAAWICGKCGEAFEEVSMTEPSGAAQPVKDAAEQKTAEPTANAALKQHIEPAQSERRWNSEKPVDPVFEVEQITLKADIYGTSYSVLKSAKGYTMLLTKQLVAKALHIVDIKGRLIHEDAFVDWESGAEQLDDILGKLMQKNDGYVSSAQLYEYAKADMNMFLNDNGMNEERAVYDMAQHLFEKVSYHGRNYKFSGKAHISSPEANISTGLDVYKKFAADKGGVFSQAELVDYLGSVGLNKRNFRTQMRIPSQPIFFYCESDVFMYAESMHINSVWYNKVGKALELLLCEAGGHIILRKLPAAWLEQLPELPGGRAWTPLLLQSVLRCYGKRLNARTIPAMDGQLTETLHAMLVPLDSPIHSFGDVVVAWLMDSKVGQRTFEAEELRAELVNAGIIKGNELIWNMPKALKNDERFAWDAGGTRVTIEVK